MNTLEIILTALCGVSGIGNIAQWVSLKAIRQKAGYEAENVHIESLQKVIELQAAEIKRLQERQEQLEQRIAELETRK